MNDGRSRKRRRARISSSERPESRPGFRAASAAKHAADTAPSRWTWSSARRLARAVVDVKEKVRPCSMCFNMTDTDPCALCTDPGRDRTRICVVEQPRDVVALEETGAYRGLYHVLGGKISPMEGVGPQDLTIDSLVEKVRNGEVEELIFALSATMEGDTTNFYMSRQLEGMPVKLTTIARGIPVGDDLEYADEVTLGRSILQRIPFEGSLNR